jgi:hypothetical protein
MCPPEGLKAAPNDSPERQRRRRRANRSERHVGRDRHRGSVSIGRSVLVLPADAELVAGRVGHDTKPVRLIVVQPEALGAELLSAVDPLQGIVNEDVDVQPVLDLLRLWDTLQVEHGKPRRWLEIDPTSVNISDNSISKKPHPEPSDRTRVDHVDAHFNCSNRVHGAGR